MPTDNLDEGNISELQRFENWLATRGQALTHHQKKIAKAFFSGGFASGKTFLICALFEYDSRPEQHMPPFVTDPKGN